MPQLSDADIRDLARWTKEMRGKWEWKLKRFILPQQCSVTKEWSGFFSEMYVGRREAVWTPRTTFRKIVSKETMMLAMLKDEEIW